MSDVFLGVIAVSVLVMAGIQVAGIIMAARVARRVDRVADRVEQGVDKLFVGLQGLTDDAARAASVFSGMLNIFRKSRPAESNAARTSGDPDDPMFIG